MAFLDVGFSGARIGKGIVAGLVGGVVFGMLMTMMGMMQMVAMLVGSTSLVVGWTLHLFNSAVFGALLAIAIKPTTWQVGLAGGVLWGLILWLVAAMLVMRTWLGMPIALDQTAWLSMMGHVIYGLLAGGVLSWLTRRADVALHATARTAV